MNRYEESTHTVCASPSVVTRPNLFAGANGEGGLPRILSEKVKHVTIEVRKFKVVKNSVLI